MPLLEMSSVLPLPLFALDSWELGRRKQALFSFLTRRVQWGHLRVAVPHLLVESGGYILHRWHYPVFMMLAVHVFKRC